jgi:hypothetical protein
MADAVAGVMFVRFSVGAAEGCELRGVRHTAFVAVVTSDNSYSAEVCLTKRGTCRSELARDSVSSDDNSSTDIPSGEQGGVPTRSLLQ